jgi:hypothetical protein
MPYCIVDDHENGVLCVETRGELSEVDFACLLKDLMQSDVLREYGRILMDHTRLDKMGGGYGVSHPAISGLRDIPFKGDTFQMAVVNCGASQEGLGRQTVTVFESITGAQVDRRRFENREAALSWLTSGDD